MATLQRVLFAGGGTGGHLFPGIAVARVIAARHQGAQITFAGTGRGVEARVVGAEGFAFKKVRSRGLVGKSLQDMFKTVLLAPFTILDAVRVLYQTKPDLVIGLGGYSSGPLVLLAASVGRPTMVLEQNVVPGATNRWLAPFVQAAAVPYETTASYFGRKAYVTGNPVREGFLKNQEITKPGRTRVLVLGGSQGAHSINCAMATAAPTLKAAGGCLEVVHQTGPKDVTMVEDAYKQAGLDARVQDFINGIHTEMHAADVVVCRAGATTLAEVAATGKPSLIVPLSVSANDHQRLNAKIFVLAEAAEMVEENELELKFSKCLLDLIMNVPHRRVMSEAARRLSKPHAATAVVEFAERIVRGDEVAS